MAIAGWNLRFEDVVKVGDYIVSTPLVENITLAGVLGMKGAQTLHPSKANLWRVISKESICVNAIPAVSPGFLEVHGLEGWQHYRKLLSLASSYYADGDAALHSEPLQVSKIAAPLHLKDFKNLEMLREKMREEYQCDSAVLEAIRRTPPCDLSFFGYRSIKEDAGSYFLRVGVIAGGRLTEKTLVEIDAKGRVREHSLKLALCPVIHFYFVRHWTGDGSKENPYRINYYT